MNVHGYSRATHDLDIFIRPTESNAEAAYRALGAVSAPIGDIVSTDLLDDERQFRYGTDGDYIDILNWIGNQSFDEVWLDRF